MMFIVLAIFLIYSFLIIWLIVGWGKAMQATVHHSDSDIKISVVVPVRNEASVIHVLLNDLASLEYTRFEVIIVDDHSEDNTGEIVSKFNQSDNRFRLINSSGIGKKQALTAGVETATGDIVVTTDADCRVGKSWLRCFNNYFQDENAKLVFGGVRIKADNGLFSKLQALEFSSLIGSGAATLSLGYPTMCNGANLAFRKSIFTEVGGYDDNLHIPSGDDEFLLRKVFNAYPEGIFFMNSPESVVETSPQKNGLDFIQQRLRWAGKWRHHKTISTWALAVFIFLFQCSVILLPVVVWARWVRPELALLLLFTKVFFEYLFLMRVSAFLRIEWNWLSFILLQLLYPLYVVAIGLISNLVRFKWKGRKLESATLKVKTINACLAADRDNG